MFTPVETSFSEMTLSRFETSRRAPMIRPGLAGLVGRRPETGLDVVPVRLPRTLAPRLALEDDEDEEGVKRQADERGGDEAVLVAGAQPGCDCVVLRRVSGLHARSQCRTGAHHGEDHGVLAVSAYIVNSQSDETYSDEHCAKHGLRAHIPITVQRIVHGDDTPDRGRASSDSAAEDKPEPVNTPSSADTPQDQARRAEHDREP